jgi:ATP-binding cassette subfamily C (CFTR/MRP) protein 5
MSAFIVEIRKKEHDYLQKTAYCQSLSISMAPTVPVISAIITFLAHVGAGNSLTAAQVLLLQCSMSIDLRQRRYLIQK